MNTALIVIDIQKDYFPGGRHGAFGLRGRRGQGRAGPGLVSGKGLARDSRAASVRAPGRGLLHSGHARSGVPPLRGSACRAKPSSQKHFPNSFRGTALQDKLDEANVKRLVIAGMMSHMCVDATTRAAFDLGYQCVVLADACATRELEFGHVKVPAAHVHASFMAALGAVYAEVPE